MLKYLFHSSGFLFVCYFLILLTSAIGKRVSVSEKPLILVKRNENDLQACLDNFDIHTDKIIRTQDSRAMGAKYINERDVSSREDCLKLCCETENCDVFVFEEKSPGSCYLFECGSPEDFKCKFTKHKNYTSAVLAVNRHLTELETQIKFTQHEHELTKLREPVPMNNPVPQVIIKTTTEVPVNKETLQIVPERTHESETHLCSRYQFPCHSSGECIAIYNACDGIPQCADGSDEAPELGCPGQSTTTSPKPAIITIIPQINGMRQGKIENEGNGPVNSIPAVQPQYKPNSETPQRQWNQQQQFNVRKHPETEIQNSAPVNPPPNLNQGGNVQNARASYGREGEGLVYPQQPEQIWPYQYHPNSGSSQIFTHKGNGLVQQAERYPQHPYAPFDSIGGNGGQYNEHVQNDFKYNYVDGVPYRMYPQGPQVNSNWETPHKNHEIQANPPEELPISNAERGHNVNSAPQDYYYEDFYRRGQQPQFQRFPMPHSAPSTHIQTNDLVHPDTHPSLEKNQLEGKNNENVELKNEKSHINPEAITHSAAPKPTNTPKVAQHGHIHNAHTKMEKLTAEVTLRETTFSDSELDGHSSSPSGAILSLTFGLCITGIMIVLVGCRMRMVHRRMRRGGKSPYAHDADFLVNGMYL